MVAKLMKEERNFKNSNTVKSLYPFSLSPINRGSLSYL